MSKLDCQDEWERQGVNKLLTAGPGEKKINIVRCKSNLITSDLDTFRYDTQAKDSCKIKPSLAERAAKLTYIRWARLGSYVPRRIRDCRFSSLFFFCHAAVQSAVLETKQSGQRTAGLKMTCVKKRRPPLRSHPEAVLTRFRFDFT